MVRTTDFLSDAPLSPPFPTQLRAELANGREIIAAHFRKQQMWVSAHLMYPEARRLRAVGKLGRGEER
eukprot:1195213-Prorocentrum_minimum.AAC.5